MKEFSEKLLLLAAGAAAGAVGYMAIRHPEELKELVGEAVQAGRKVFEAVEQSGEYEASSGQAQE